MIRQDGGLTLLDRLEAAVVGVRVVINAPCSGIRRTRLHKKHSRRCEQTGPCDSHLTSPLIGHRYYHVCTASANKPSAKLLGFVRSCHEVRRFPEAGAASYCSGGRSCRLAPARCDSMICSRDYASAPALADGRYLAPCGNPVEHVAGPNRPDTLRVRS